MRLCQRCVHYEYLRDEDLHSCRKEEEQGVQLPDANDCPYYEHRQLTEYSEANWRR